jgi:hypothetical protein
MQDWQVIGTAKMVSKDGTVILEVSQYSIYESSVVVVEYIDVASIQVALAIPL